MPTISQSSPPSRVAKASAAPRLESAQIGLLIEVSPGIGALFAAERDGRNVVPTVDRDVLLSGSCEPGGALWLALKRDGWRWVQDSSFGPKYWRREATAQPPSPPNVTH